MSKRFLLALALCLGIALITAEPSSAQPRPRAAPNYGPGYRPRLSPYLNLLRGGDIAANYYLGVESEVDRRAAQRTFRGQIGQLGQEVTRLEDKEIDRAREKKTSGKDSFEGPKMRRAFGLDAPSGIRGPFGR